MEIIIKIKREMITIKIILREVYPNNINIPISLILDERFVAKIIPIKVILDKIKDKERKLRNTNAMAPPLLP